MKLKQLIIGIMLLPVLSALGQSGDSLTLSQVINRVLENYPSIIKAQKNIEAAGANIDLAKTAYYPDVNVSANYGHVGPTSSFDLSALGLGTVQMNSADNYGLALNINQLIYDFGRTAKNLELQKGGKSLNELGLEQTKQQLSLAVAGNFYSIAFLQQAIKIKDEEIAALNEHLAFVQKKVETGSATKFEILSTQVRISTIENQKTDLVASLASQLRQLNSFLGNSQNVNLLLKTDLLSPQEISSVESLSQTAFDNRKDLKMAEERKSMSESKLKLLDTQYYPILNFFASGGWKNGYIPDLNKFTPNYQVGIGLKIPIFDSGKTRYSKVVTSKEIEVGNQDIDLIRRDIVNALTECKTATEAALKKVHQSELQLTQAQQAYQLAETNYRAGAITNLDLLDSYTALSDTQLSLYKSQIDYTLNYLKLKINLGEKIYF